MNRLLSMFAMAAMLISTPVMAKDRDHQRRNNNDLAVGVVVGVLGSIIVHEVTKNDRHDNRRDRNWKRDKHHRDYNRGNDYRQDYRQDYQRDRNYYEPRRHCRAVSVYGLRGYRGQLIIDNGGGGAYSYERVGGDLCLDGRGPHTIVHDRNHNNRFDRGDGVAEVRGGVAHFRY